MKQYIPVINISAAIILILSGFFACLKMIPGTMTPLMTGLILAYACDPLIDFFEAKGVARERAVFWFFILLGFVLLLLVTILIPNLVTQLQEFISNFPDMAGQVVSWIASAFSVESSAIRMKLSDFMKQQYSPENFSRLAGFLKISFASTAGWFASLAAALIAPVFFYFFLVDIDRIRSGAFRFIPRKYQAFIRVRLLKMDSILSGFIRGQLMAAFILSLLYSLGLMIVGVRYGILIGFTSGILSIVPYLGTGVGLAASVIMAFFSPDVLTRIAGIAAVFGVVQVLEGFVITPRVVGKTVGLSPFMTIVSLMIGGELFGISGMLAAVPVAGMIRVLSRDARAAYLKSGFYRIKKTGGQ